MRKSVFGVSDQVQHKPDCSATEDGKRLEISNLGSRPCCGNNGADQLRGYWVFDFAYAKKRLFHDGTPLIFLKFKYKKNCNHHS